MNIVQFFRILLAHRALIGACAAICLVVGVIAINVIPPRYEAYSRVMLDAIKPDPVTGQVISPAYLRAYTRTQIELIKDQQVSRLVVQDLKWQSDPARQRAYRNREGGRDLDFDTWASKTISEGAQANVIMGSNILEIGYSSTSPSEARLIADALQKAYMDVTLQTRREAARRNADWYEGQAEKARKILFDAEASKAAYERETGIVLQEDKIDIDSARLAALASQGAAPVFASAGSATAASVAQLGLLDAEIAEQTKVLGPNHPTLQQLKVRRNLLAQQVEQERNSSAAATGAAMNASRATSGMLEQQKAKVMAQREQVERLRLMQDDIDLRREQYKQSVARSAQLRQESDVAEAGVTPLSSAITPQSPVFPNKLLIVGASVPGGVALGILLALLLELMGRRVRSADDLVALAEAPVLAVIRNPNLKSVQFRFPTFRRGKGGPMQAARA
ncbi:Wzz/FepE/Etk N-terminal domain-containing protein [Phenylobacterium sp.]|uniref:GumC family protein n=1 Tax=Phenylobacterium sp. TaxID=1871053 RepID=UPI00301D9799